MPHQTETGRKADVQLVTPHQVPPKASALFQQARPQFEEAYFVVRRVAEIHAARAIRTRAFSQDDREDLIQEAALACWVKFKVFDSSRASPSTFIELVVDSNMTSIIRARMAAKRLGDRCERLAGIQGEPFGHGPDLCLRIDVLRTLGRLPKAAREVVLMLADSSPSEVSRATAISRAGIYRIIRTARAAFVEAGLRPREENSGKRRPSRHRRRLTSTAGKPQTRSPEASDANRGC